MTRQEAIEILLAAIACADSEGQAHEGDCFDALGVLGVTEEELGLPGGGAP